MAEIIRTIHLSAMALGMVTVLALAAACAIAMMAKSAHVSIRRLRLSRRATALAAGVVLAVTYYGGSKGISYGPTFPQTNAEMALLYNDGTSYVSNDVVRVGYLRHRILPDTADINIWRREHGNTNDEDWVAHFVSTIRDSPPPIMINFSAATNYDWIVFTTWQPGPSVKTNGVLYSSWRGVPGPIDVRVFGVPVRTLVLEDGNLIAPNRTNTGDNP